MRISFVDESTSGGGQRPRPYRIVKRPATSVTSVDTALRLISAMRRLGPLGPQEAAQMLGIAPATAMRMLATLEYRGFAKRVDDRRYAAGPALDEPSPHRDERARFAAALPSMALLADRTGESVSLLRRDRTRVDFLMAVESRHAERVQDRTGTVLPARATSGGKALLAELGDPGVRMLYGPDGQEPLDEASLRTLLDELAEVRRAGIGVNVGGTEDDVAAIGMVIPSTLGTPTHAIAVSAPMARAAQLEDSEATTMLWQCCTSLGPVLDGVLSAD